MIEEAHEPVKSMRLSCQALVAGRTSIAEQYLVDVQIRTMRLLRKLRSEWD